MNWKSVQKYKPFVAILTLILVIFFLIKLVNPIFFKNSLNHDSPQSYMASDAYHLLVVIEHVTNEGTYRDMPKVLVDFSNETYLPFEPPLSIYYSAGISNVLGVRSFDGNNLGLLLLLITVVVIAFLLLYQIDESVSIIFLPYLLLIAVFPYSSSITWGFWRQLMGIITLFFATIFLLEKNSIKNAILLGIIFSLTVLSYPLYGVFFLVLLFAYRLFQFLFDKNIKKTAIFLALILLVGAVLSSVYIFEYKVIYKQDEGTNYGFASQLLGHYDPWGNPAAKLTFSKIWLLPVIGFISLLVLAYFFLSLKNNRINNSTYLTFFILFLTSLGSVGIMKRTYIFRYLWPAIFCIIVSIGVYVILKLIFKDKDHYTFIVSILFFIVFLFVTWNKVGMYASIESNGLVSPQEWASFEYVKKNTPTDSTVLLIDPTMTQEQTSWHLDRPIRHLSYFDIMPILQNNISLEKANSTKICQFPRYTFRDLKVVRVIPHEVCDKKENYPVCSFDYIIIVLVNSPEYLEWINNQGITDDFVLEKDFSGVLLFKNKEKRCLV